ncbi:MAG: hypothetical protein JWQ71_4119, partial [Pedosphaera sp.]|nr:hypothetical protein [Pedosphaera sp.]
MTFWTLILRSLRFHARAHLGVVLGAAVGSAALVGALVVGDSVKESLKELGLIRLGKVDAALASNDRFFRAPLAKEVQPAVDAITAAVLQLPGTVTTEDASARANRVQILGVDNSFWKLASQESGVGEIANDGVVLNEPLATQLKVKQGDTVLLRMQKPSLLSRDAPLTPQEDSSVALRLKVQSIVTDEQFGRFSLQANQVAPFNAFINLAQLQEKIGQKERANLLLVGESQNKKNNLAEAANQILRQHWELADAELELRQVPTGALELRTDRVFLDTPVVDAAQKVSPGTQPVLTYFVNELRRGSNSTPYSMVT